MGSAQVDTVQFTTGDQLAAATTIEGNAGTDVIHLTTADTTIVDADFTDVAEFETLTLTGASTAVLGLEAAAAGFETGTEMLKRVLASLLVRMISTSLLMQLLCQRRLDAR